MRKLSLNRKKLFLKFRAAIVAIMIVISSAAMIEVMIREGPEIKAEPSFLHQPFTTRPCKLSSVLSQAGLWISFDSTPEGTPAEAHVTVSDTTGITIVADFHGFWKSTYSISGTPYDHLEMPGANYILDEGKPMLPRITEYVEIPRDIDISLEIIASSHDTTSGYDIRPALPFSFPAGTGENSIVNITSPPTIRPPFFGSVYSNNAFFPGARASIEGDTSSTSMIVRGHRVLGISFHPVQYNPVTEDVIVYSQLIVKIVYSRPAQIQPIPDSLRSDAFERILKNSLLHYDSCHVQEIQPGLPSVYTRSPPPPPSLPNATVPQFHLSSRSSDYVTGAEYMIITSETFKFQAQRLAEWKERKGIPSQVVTVSTETSRDRIRENVKGWIEYAYYNWYPAPTYVLLFGDVETIPANYDIIHDGRISWNTFWYQDGYIASDLGYFNIEGNSYFPDMIYGRLSVDTEEQAEIVVNKTLQYELSPPSSKQFYNDILTAGYFEDNDLNGVEDAGVPFLYYLESIRQYLINEHKYNVHYNYSCSANHKLPVSFHAPLEVEDGSSQVSEYISADYNWLWGYDDKPEFYEYGNANITSNFNDGRFLAIFFSHGGSKNMKYPINWPYSSNNRDLVEGWHQPCFNTSSFSDLINRYNLPLVLSIACNTGWFDGETDQLYMDLDSSGGVYLEDNPFGEYENECFAENITRLEGGGAIATIAPSRITESRISGDLLNGIIQAFWPGLLESGNQPIYEIGAALYSGKLHAASKWMHAILPMDVVRLTFEVFHLFGDPETQLWTDVPSHFDVSYPASIGISDPQKFVVSVRNESTGEPVEYAKVCVQQDQYIYQVGYTDPNGQIIFDINPADTSMFLNLTVTKHNFEPYMGEIYASAPQFSSTVEEAPKITLSQDYGVSPDIIEILVSGFNEESEIYVRFGEIIVIIPEGSRYAEVPVQQGPPVYINVRAVQGSTITNTIFKRLSSYLNPDPFIYSQFDSSTWYLAGNELVWDNPSITIYDGPNPVAIVEQNRDYKVNVTVHNRGNGDAIGTIVTLWYAPFGGGVSETYIGSDEVDIDLFGSAEATFSWKPLFPDTECLIVKLSHTNEIDDHQINNIGQENINVIPLCSPGSGSFQVGNPTDNTDYIFIDVKQAGDYEDVWNATLRNYSSQAMSTHDSEEVTLLVDPEKELELGEERLFTVEIYCNDELVGGVVFQAVCQRNCLWILILLVVIIGAIIVVVWDRKRRA